MRVALLSHGRRRNLSGWHDGPAARRTYPGASGLEWPSRIRGPHAIVQRPPPPAAGRIQSHLHNCGIESNVGQKCDHEGARRPTRRRRRRIAGGQACASRRLGCLRVLRVPLRAFVVAFSNAGRRACVVLQRNFAIQPGDVNREGARTRRKDGATHQSSPSFWLRALAPSRFISMRPARSCAVVAEIDSTDPGSTRRADVTGAERNPPGPA